MTDTANLRTYKIDADQKQVEDALQLLAELDAYIDGGQRLGTHHVWAAYNGDIRVALTISAAALGVLIARGWVTTRSAANGSEWVISGEGAIAVRGWWLDRMERLALAQADRDHNI